MKKFIRLGCLSFIIIPLCIYVAGEIYMYLTTDHGQQISKIEQQLLTNQKIQILDLQENSNIQIAQIHRTGSNLINIIAFHDVYRDSLIQINEVSEEGQVNKILFTNNSDKHVFIMDGDIILGAKQNRVFNNLNVNWTNERVSFIG